MFLQELPDVETVTSKDQLVLFVRQWCPSTMSLKSFQEVVLDNSTMEELKQKISELSSVPVENIDVACVKPNLPCDMNLLDIQETLEWNPNATLLDQWPISAYDGCVFYYR